METVAGIDVGGMKKGFHAVALCDRRIVGVFHSVDPDAVATWCRSHAARMIGIDSPCRWGSTTSRLAERTLKIGAKKLSCFSTPSRERAEGVPFYGWVFNGERLYKALASTHPLFDPLRIDRPATFETFPMAVLCALRGRVERIVDKRQERFALLRDIGLADDRLENQDLIDAALCAVAACAVVDRDFVAFGDKAEGYIVIPRVATP